MSEVRAIDSWGKWPVYRARIIHADVGGIVVKSARDFAVGKRISFALLDELNNGTTYSRGAQGLLKWRSAVIWRIHNGCLHLTRT